MTTCSVAKNSVAVRYVVVRVERSGVVRRKMKLERGESRKGGMSGVEWTESDTCLMQYGVSVGVDMTD